MVSDDDDDEPAELPKTLARSPSKHAGFSASFGSHVVARPCKEQLWGSYEVYEGFFQKTGPQVTWTEEVYGIICIPLCGFVYLEFSRLTKKSV